MSDFDLSDDEYHFLKKYEGRSVKYFLEIQNRTYSWDTGGSIKCTDQQCDVYEKYDYTNLIRDNSLTCTKCDFRQTSMLGRPAGYPYIYPVKSGRDNGACYRRLVRQWINAVLKDETKKKIDSRIPLAPIIKDY